MGLRDAVIVGGVGMLVWRDESPPSINSNSPFILAQDMTHQAVELSRRPHVIVATPGRLAAHVQSGSGSVDLSRIKFLVLDEADRLMTNATLQPDLNVILGALPAQRQNLLFSATLLHEPQGRIAAQLRQPLFRFAVASDEATVSTLKQQYIFMPSHVSLTRL